MDRNQRSEEQLRVYHKNLPERQRGGWRAGEHPARVLISNGKEEMGVKYGGIKNDRRRS